MRQPFWEDLSPTAIKQRIDRLLAAPDNQAAVRALSPVEYTILLKESPETRPALLELAHPQQIRTVLDLDCWCRDRLQSPQVLAWLEDLLNSGHDVFVRVVQELDLELLIATFRQHMRVHMTLPIEEEIEPATYDEVLSNELYRIEFLDPDSPLNASIERLFNGLRMADLGFYHGLMQNVMWGQDSDAEEWAYRWKNGRLQDENFPNYYEARETYCLIDLDQPLSASPTPLHTPGAPENVEKTGLIPSYVWSLTPLGSFLARALTGDFSADTQERLCWEMVYLCNRELVIAQVDFTHAGAVRDSLSRVHAYLNIGLEYLSGEDTQQLVPVLATHSLLTICQVGFTLSMRLRQRALRLQTHLDHAAGVRRMLSGLTRHVLNGLLDQYPQFFEGTEYPEAVGYRDFLHLRDVQLVRPVLTALERDSVYDLRRTAS
ncbi:hypothetical protein NKDENANG_01058 [Candidatus Entotheonellaceae bacterium PAL068K]